MKTSIFFIAILPGQEIQDEITAFKQYAAKRFNSKRALTSPPHVTLVSPFKYGDEEIGKVRDFLKAFAERQNGFPVELKDFNCFAPRVIYVDVVKSAALESLHEALNQGIAACGFEAKKQEWEFHPHATVAFKDLKESMFPKAWKYFRRERYKRTFDAKALTLLKHNGKEWEIFEEYEMS